MHRETDPESGSSWHAIGRLAAVARIGDVLTTDLYGNAIIVRRDQSGLRVHSASAAAPVPRVEVWNGFLMVNPDGRASSLAPQLSGLTAHLEPYLLSDWVSRNIARIAADWDWRLSSDYFHSMPLPAWQSHAPERGARPLQSGTPGAWSLRYADVPDAARLDTLLPEYAAVPRHRRLEVSLTRILPSLHLLTDVRKSLCLRIAIHGPRSHTLHWSLMVPRHTAELQSTSRPLQDYCDLLGTLLEDHARTVPDLRQTA